MTSLPPVDFAVLRASQREERRIGKKEVSACFSLDSKASYFLFTTTHTTYFPSTPFFKTGIWNSYQRGKV